MIPERALAEDFCDALSCRSTLNLDNLEGWLCDVFGIAGLWSAMVTLRPSGEDSSKVTMAGVRPGLRYWPLKPIENGSRTEGNGVILGKLEFRLDATWEQ